MKRERAIAYGYIIADMVGLVKFETLRKSRKDAWAAFLEDKNANITKTKFQGMGFRAVPVFVKETAGVKKGE